MASRQRRQRRGVSNPSPGRPAAGLSLFSPQSTLPPPPGFTNPSVLAGIKSGDNNAEGVGQLSSPHLHWSPSTHPHYVHGNKTMANLEIGVKEGLYYLRKLKAVLAKYPTVEANNWLEDIQKIEKKAKLNQRHVIGIVGETGAGKSSLINALLDEERIVPINGMRASTATVVEISYNHDAHRYRAEVEFITADDWAKYLEVLFGDIEDGTSTAAAGKRGDDTYAIACAMIKAVYGIEPADIPNYSVDQLVRHPNVGDVLGQTIRFSHDNSLCFYHLLQKYVDSKDKRAQGAGDIEYWPLIRVVRVYVKAPMLETGAVIADLPGVKDANPARAEVAKRYLKECSCIWILAPIVRAVDNKTARDLLGESFKRQLRMDGTYDYITFICTKADDISFTEAAQTAELASQRDEIHLVKEQTAAMIASLREEKDAIAEEKDELDETIEAIDFEIDDLARTIALVRTNTQTSGDRPNLQEGPVGSATHPYAQQVFQADEEEGEDDATKLQNANAMRKQLNGQKKALDQEIKDINAQIKAKEQSLRDLIAEFKCRCVVARNDQVKLTIKQDFAEGLRDMDLADIPETGGPAPIRDYSGLANSLPVFCVSARSYQRLFAPNGTRPLLQDYETETKTMLSKLEKTIQASIYNKFDVAASRAEAQVTDVLEGWNGGEIAWNTYRAICRRKGVYDGRAGSYVCRFLNCAANSDAVCANETGREQDWNGQLAKPMLVNLTVHWERTFSNEVPAVLGAFIDACRELTTKFSKDVEKHLVSISENEPLVRKLRSQLTSYQNSLGHMHASLRRLMKQEQKNVSRNIEPNIRESLEGAYTQAGKSGGHGVFQQMKGIMTNQVNSKKDTLFVDATHDIRSLMRKAVQDTRVKAGKGLEDVHRCITRDYKAIVNRARTLEQSAVEKELEGIMEELSMFKRAAPATAMKPMMNEAKKAAAKAMHGRRQSDLL
ncbi:predicted protein [Uncinocarpus reesii 1704]|uniref:G domain-containing protein n=1 Tax=Uncinocarpus reesii (strain UAMH 1704) TaxID=336963 RepID=C4JKA2_UNCRE|nr:uncharacterized protein UREG_02059 [Uncinocarpus reesii 1704]EEP77210.1 predicted protein [Uncinocarpus reesii 1704]